MRRDGDVIDRSGMAEHDGNDCHPQHSTTTSAVRQPPVLVTMMASLVDDDDRSSAGPIRVPSAEECIEIAGVRVARHGSTQVLRARLGQWPFDGH